MATSQTVPAYLPPRPGPHPLVLITLSALFIAASKAGVGTETLMAITGMVVAIAREPFGPGGMDER